MWARVVSELWLVYYFGYIRVFLGDEYIVIITCSLGALPLWCHTDALVLRLTLFLSSRCTFCFYRIDVRRADNKNKKIASRDPRESSLIGKERETKIKRKQDTLSFNSHTSHLGGVTPVVSYLYGGAPRTFDFYRIDFRNADNKNQNLVSGIQDRLAIFSLGETNKADFSWIPRCNLLIFMTCVPKGNTVKIKSASG